MKQEGTYFHVLSCNKYFDVIFECRLYEIVLHELPAHLTDLAFRLHLLVADTQFLIMASKFFVLTNQQIFTIQSHDICCRLIGGKPFAVRLCGKMTRGMRSLEYFTTHQVWQIIHCKFKF